MENKVALAICLSLIIALAGFSAWLYVGAKGLESEVSDMESKTSNLETQNVELESQVNDLESRLNDSESRCNDVERRVSEQLLVAGYPDEPQSILFMIMHIGTADVTLSEIQVDGTLNSSSPGWAGNITLTPGQMGQITVYGSGYLVDGFENGESYQFSFITTKGNSFHCVVVYEGWTIIRPEKLQVVNLVWNNSNAIFTVRNVGTIGLTVVEVRVNDEYATMNPASVSLDPGSETTVVVSRTEGFTSGVKYEFAFITATGNRFSYMATAP